MNNLIKSETIYFRTPGPINTDNSIKYALKRCKKGDIKSIVVATSSGDTGIKVAKSFSEIKIIPVWLNAGSSKSQTKEFRKNKKLLMKQNIEGIQGIQAFSGVERAIFQRWLLLDQLC